MCRGYEWEIVKRAYEEQVARRNRDQAAEEKKQGSVAPPQPAEQQPRVRDKEPVPA
jgi:hypothetical protein